MHRDEHQQLAAQAAALLTERHRKGLRPDEQLSVQFSGAAPQRRVELRLHDVADDRLLELFADLPELDEAEALALGLDFLDGVLAEILASDRALLPPLQPMEYRFEGQRLWLSGDLRRPRLEAEADALLDEDR